MSEDSLADLGQTLASSFCQGLDRQAILELIRKKKDRLGVREAAVSIWGISDVSSLNRLVGLGLSVETVMAVSLTPLVEVAWADGRITRKERASVLAAARDYGLHESDPSYAMLVERLAERPERDLFETWRAYIRVLSGALDAESMEALRELVTARTRGVAKARGGLFGRGAKLDDEEIRVLNAVEDAFR